jgi:glycerol-3-phosphate dehydrogenase
VKAGGKGTAELSRDFLLRADQPGLLTITGGKWTTYRSMAEACVTEAARLAGLPRRPSPTRTLRLHGYHPDPAEVGGLAVYGSDATEIRRLTDDNRSLATRLHPMLPYTGAEVVWATRAEMARTVADVLARRTRAVVLNTRTAVEVAPRVAALMARELGRDSEWETAQVRAFNELARGYLPPSG